MILDFSCFTTWGKLGNLLEDPSIELGLKWNVSHFLPNLHVHQHLINEKRLRGEFPPAWSPSLEGPSPTLGQPQTTAPRLHPDRTPGPPYPATVFPAQTQRLLEEGVARSKFSRYRKLSVSGSGVMAGSYAEGAPAVLADKRQQFGNRFLSDPARVFHHNAW